MKKIVLVLFFSLLITHYSLPIRAYPLSEKTPASATVPLDILSAQPSVIFVPTFGDDADRYMFTAYGSTLTIIDLQNWSEYETQPDSFEEDIADMDLLANGTSLIIATTDGNLARIELDDEDTFFDTEDSDETDDEDTTEEEDVTTITDSREIILEDQMTEPAISHLAADPDDEDYVYLVNASGYYYEVNLDNEDVTEVELTGNSRSKQNLKTDEEEDEEDTTSNYLPTDIVFAQANGGDVLVIPTDTGDVITIAAGSSSYTATTNESTAVTDTPNFSAIALTPDNDYAYLIDSANDVLWVFSIPGAEFIDQQDSGTSLDPIEVDSDTNLDFADVILFEDLAGAIVAYVSGTNGITVLAADDPTVEFSLVDADPAAGGDDDPITMSATAGLLATTTADAGYIFSANSDATISVLSEGPWVTIVSIDPDSVTADASTFAITFQTDTAGTYTIKSNSSLSGEGGTELVAETDASTVDTDIVTPTIDINSFARSTFVEGNNNILVFVTDAESRVGHNAAVLHVDRPPEAITISNTNFGNKKAYVDFAPSPDADISYYYVYAEPAENQASPACPGTLTFASTNTVTNTFYATECGDSLCEADVSNLTNDVTYCIAVKVVDEGGQESPVATYAEAVTPRLTVGPAGYFGETSCSLNATQQTSEAPWWALLLAIGPVGLIRLIKPIKKPFGFFIVLLLVLPFAAHAVEKTPQHWTLEVRGTSWFPTETGMKDFIGSCCHFGGEAEFGWLYKNQLNVVLGTGFMPLSGDAVAITDGTVSADTYHLYLIPVRLDAIYRLDLKSDQIILPYVRAGLDAVVFYENTAGDTITNVKYGVHGGIGVGFLLDRVESLTADIESDMGINDIYLIFEGRYAYLNSFKSTGMDLSGFYPYVGLLFEF